MISPDLNAAHFRLLANTYISDHTEQSLDTIIGLCSIEAKEGKYCVGITNRELITQPVVNELARRGFSTTISWEEK
jgi:hypothetical protein